MSFDFEVETNYPRERGKVRLASIDPDRFMNFILIPNTVESHNITVDVEGAKKVRDALIRAYPIEPAKPEPSEYKAAARYDGKWYVYQEVALSSEKTIASCLTEANAKKIAQALNEAEGL